MGCKGSSRINTLVGLGLGTKSGNVEEFPILPCTDIHSIFTVSEGVLEKHREEDPEQGWCQDTSLFHSTADWKRFQGSPVEADRALHVLVEGGDDCE